MPVPDHRLAICHRCRWPSRIANGAASDQALLDHAKQLVAAGERPVHCRISQCLNCCDGGHTVRVELRGREVCLVGIRTPEELARVLEAIDEIGNVEIPPALQKRVWQIWRDGKLVWHRNDPADLP